MTGLRSAAERAEIRKRFSKHPVTSQRVDARKVDADCLLPWIRERAAAFPEDSREYLEELTLAFLDSHSRSLQADELYDAIGVLGNVAFEFVVDLWHHLLDAQVSAIALSSSARGHESSQAQFVSGVPSQIEGSAKLFPHAPEVPEFRRPQSPREKLDHVAEPSDLQSLDRREHQSLQEANSGHGNNHSASELHAGLASNCNISRDPDAVLGQTKGTGLRAFSHANAPGPCETAPIVVGISEGHHILDNESKSKGQAASQSYRVGDDRPRSLYVEDSHGRRATRKRSRFSRDQRHVSPPRGFENAQDAGWDRGLETDRPATVEWDMEGRSRGEASREVKAKLSREGAGRYDEHFEKRSGRDWDSGSHDMKHAGGRSLRRNGSGFEGSGNHDYRAYRHRDDRRSESLLKPGLSEGGSGRQRDASRRRDCTDEVAKHDGYPSPYCRDDRRASESRPRKSDELTEVDSRNNHNGYYGHAKDALPSGPRYKGPREIGDLRREGFQHRRRLVGDRFRGRTRQGNSSPAALDFDHIPPLPKKARKSLEGEEEFFHSSASKNKCMGHGESHRKHGLMTSNSPPDRRGLLSANRLLGPNAELSGDGVKKHEDLPVLNMHLFPNGSGRLSSSPLPIVSRREESDFKDLSNTTHLEKHVSSRTLQRVASTSDRLEAMKKTLLLKLKVQRSLGMRNSSRKLEKAGDISNSSGTALGCKRQDRS